jgi:hypothetical protein
METIHAKFDVAKWDEHAFDVHAGTAKLTNARVTKTYTGDLEGTSVTEWVMAYEPSGSASFVGIERIDGSIDGRAGTIVLRHVGRFESGVADAELNVLGGSCTGAFTDASGLGRLTADPAGRIELQLTVA